MGLYKQRQIQRGMHAIAKGKHKYILFACRECRSNTAANKPMVGMQIKINNIKKLTKAGNMDISFVAIPPCKI